VMYPMPGTHRVPEKPSPDSTGKFRLVYVGSVQNFYGRMLCSLIQKIEAIKDLEIVVVGPNADWPQQILERAKGNGIYLGLKSPDEAAGVIASADALLVVMSFEGEHELFMRTSFTTKFVDYVTFEKPVILWAPDYCTPVRVVRKNGGAAVVNEEDPEKVVSICRRIAEDAAWRKRLSVEAARLYENLFNPERLQAIFVDEIEKLIGNRVGGT
jgi:glycosyl transferase family 1